MYALCDVFTADLLQKKNFLLSSIYVSLYCRKCQNMLITVIKEVSNKNDHFYQNNLKIIREEAQRCKFNLSIFGIIFEVYMRLVPG